MKLNALKLGAAGLGLVALALSLYMPGQAVILQEVGVALLGVGGLALGAQKAAKSKEQS